MSTLTMLPTTSSVRSNSAAADEEEQEDDDDDDEEGTSSEEEEDSDDQTGGFSLGAVSTDSLTSGVRGRFGSSTMSVDSIVEEDDDDEGEGDEEEEGGKLGGFEGERREAGLVGSRNGNKL